MASTDVEGRPAADTRARLIGVAVDLFTRHSFAGTSLQMIADHIGFTKAAIYHHFRTREQLLLAVLEPLLEELRTVVDAAEAKRSVNARADRMLTGYATLAVRNRGVLWGGPRGRSQRCLDAGTTRGVDAAHRPATLASRRRGPAAGRQGQGGDGVRRDGRCGGGAGLGRTRRRRTTGVPDRCGTPNSGCACATAPGKRSRNEDCGSDRRRIGGSAVRWRSA